MIGLGQAGGSVGKAGRLKTTNDANTAWTVNQRGSGNIVDFQAVGVSKFKVTAAGVGTIAGDTICTLTAAQTLTSKVLTSPDVNGGTVDSLTSLSIRSTGAAYDLLLATGVVFTANRTLTITIPNAATALTLTGDLIRVGAHSLTLTTSAATDVTLPTTGTLATLAGTEELTNKTLNASVLKGTFTASGTVTLPAITMGASLTFGTSALQVDGKIVLGSTLTHNFNNARIDYITRIGGNDGLGLTLTGNGRDTDATARNIVLATLSPATDTNYTALTVVANTTAPYVSLGIAGTNGGDLRWNGLTSGTATIVGPAAITSYTLTLPAAANANSGYQLTCVGADTITSWAAAASLREYKDIIGEHSPQDALDKILHTRVYDFHYKEGKGTGDRETGYVGPMADEAPWATHYKGAVVNPVNTLGFMVLGFQAHEERIKELERELAELRRG